MQRWIVSACLAAGGLWGLGRMLGERGLVASLLFYIPAPLAAGALLFAAVLLRRAKKLALGTLALAILPLAVTIAEQHWRAPAPRPPGAGETLSVLHWNVCRGKAGWPRIAARIAEESPELAILSEVILASDAKELEKLLPRYPYRQFANPMMVLSRYPLDPIRLVHNGSGLRLYQLALHQESATWRFFALDVVADPEAPRAPGLQILAGKVRDLQPDFLAGDFNTPRQSRWLSPVAPGYAHAYDLAGHGWSYTWPTPFPVLSLDHLFVDQAKVEVAGYEIGSSLWSDHRFQRAILRRRP